MKKGYMFITSTGYDPEKGKHVKDPFLGDIPTFGACMPNIRKYVQPGDSIFVISGKVPKVPQYIMGGFEVAEKIHAMDAYQRFPEHRLYKRNDEQLAGNIITNARGEQHFLDSHNNWEKRLENYIVGKNLITLTTPEEIAKGRAGTLGILKELFGKDGRIPRDIIGRMCKLDEEQVEKLRMWLISLITVQKQVFLRVAAGQTPKPFNRQRVQLIFR